MNNFFHRLDNFQIWLHDTWGVSVFRLYSLAAEFDGVYQHDHETRTRERN